MLDVLHMKLTYCISTFYSLGSCEYLVLLYISTFRLCVVGTH